jgi:hypothetical protein
VGRRRRLVVLRARGEARAPLTLDVPVLDAARSFSRGPA